MADGRKIKGGYKEMKYIIMCGGTYKKWWKPRQLAEIKGEALVARTIRLLRENGVEDIAISTNHDGFEGFGVPILKHNNPYKTADCEGELGDWVDAFYPIQEPACFLMGDVFFSPEAIKTIVETETNSIEFFASAPPFDKRYHKPWAEPFAFKVEDVFEFRECIVMTKLCERFGFFARRAISWELWQVIKRTPLNMIKYSNYTVINDYTCDVDEPDDIKFFEEVEE